MMPTPPLAVAQAATLAELFAARVAASPEAPAYREFDAAGGQWLDVSWREAGSRVAVWRRALRRSGLGHGERIASLLPNGVDAVCLDQAGLSLGCVTVPLHDLDNPASIAYVLDDCEASFLLVARLEQWLAIVGTGVALPALRTVVVRSPGEGFAAEPRVAGLPAWLAAGEGAQDGEAPAPGPEDLASIVYTSGTTGRPKGVMLTHANVLANVRASMARVMPRADDVFLSFLPLSHTFERTAGYYLPVAAGSCVAYARSVAQLAEDLRTVRPTILISVPRIYERFHARLQEAMRGSPGRERLFAFAQAVGWRRFRRRQGLRLAQADARAPAWLDALAWPLVERLVAQRVRAPFGGRLRVAVSGGAPLAPAIARCFLGLGVPLLQGYGMTETSPVVAVNAPDDNDPATVGRPLPGVEVRIGENHELLVRGPSVMRGYWKRPGDTARALAADGWLATGDQAAIEDGRIRIRGRIKEIIVTSTGEKIAPADLELAIIADPLFAQAYVVGEQKPFIACVAVLDPAQWRDFAAGLGRDPAAPASLADTAVRAAALERIRVAAAGFPHYAVPRAVWLTLEPWTSENGLITPTLKLKRNHLASHFAEVLDALYRR